MRNSLIEYEKSGKLVKEAFRTFRAKNGKYTTNNGFKTVAIQPFPTYNRSKKKAVIRRKTE